MSYDIYLKDKDGNNFALEVPLEEGGIQLVGGNIDTWLTISG